jgi:hypothetical protein
MKRKLDRRDLVIVFVAIGLLAFTANQALAFSSNEGVEFKSTAVVMAIAESCRPTRDSYVMITFRITEVFAGTVVSVGDRFDAFGDLKGPSFRDEPLWPIPKTGDHGIWAVWRHDGILSYMLDGPCPYFRRAMEGNVGYKEDLIVARDVQTFTKMVRPDDRISFLRGKMNSGLPMECDWSVWTLARAYPNVLIDMSFKLTSNDQMPFVSQVAIEREMARICADRWVGSTTRKRMLDGWKTCKPLQGESQAMAQYLNIAAQLPIATDRVLVPTCLGFVMNKDANEESRLTVVRGLEYLARGSNFPEARDALLTIKSSNAGSRVKKEAAGWLEYDDPQKN